MSDLVPRATVDTLVAQRNRALALYEQAHVALVGASEALQEAAKAKREAFPGVNGMNHHLHEARQSFLASLDVPERDAFMADARRITDTDVWSHIVAITDLERLMDRKAKDEMRQQLVMDPPEVTAENVFATIETFVADAGTIFKRGIAECFSNLDRRFRSHDGWKIGSRVILSHAFNEYGSWNFYRNHRDTLTDIERTFMVLEGREQPKDYAGIVGVLEQARSGWGMGPRQTEVHSEFFTVRVFKNGNCHVWFRRDDLVERVNKLLAEYYGAVIPEEREAEEDPFSAPKTAPAKNYGFFPTPDAPAEMVIEEARLRHGDEPLTVLEPSAGTGNLARRAVEKGALVDCIEWQPALAADLRATGLYRRVTQGDFLTVQPGALYDRILMNPPFDRERDIDHVMHALRFLKPDGRLVAIMSAGTEFRETKKSAAFRDLVAQKKGRFRDLPARSFSDVGTNVNTILLTLCNEVDRFAGEAA